MEDGFHGLQYIPNLFGGLCPETPPTRRSTPEENSSLLNWIQIRYRFSTDFLDTPQ